MKVNWTLLAKQLSGEANETEQEEIRRWIQRNSENKKWYDMLRKNWGPVSQEDESIRVDVDKAWMNLHNRLEREQLIPRASMQPLARIMPLRVMRLAAAAALLLALGTTAWLVIQSQARAIRMTAVTQDQQRFGLVLPDGSRVDLNANSKLDFRLSGSGVRMVKLEGEAWFDVRHDEQSSFILRAGKGTVQVTGTTFTVRTVPGADRTEVYVESGNVQFFRSGKLNRTLSLQAGQMGVLENNRLSEELQMEPNHLSWKTKKLVFRDTPLGDVAGILDRTYSQSIRFTEESLEDCLFTGTFDQEPMDSVVRVLQVAFGLEVLREGKAYVFSGDGCQ